MASPRRSKTRRRSATPRRSGASQQLPVPGPGERIWVLDVPYGTQVDGASWHPTVKTHLFVGRDLPPHLAPYVPGPHTLGRCVDTLLNQDLARAVT